MKYLFLFILVVACNSSNPLGDESSSDNNFNPGATSGTGSDENDTTPPLIIGLSNDPSWTNSKTWNWDCNEQCRYKYTVDANPLTEPSSSYDGTTSTVLSAGTGTFYLHVKALDASSNESETIHVSTLIDTTAPIFASAIDTTTFDSDLTTARTATWTTGSDAHSGLAGYQIAIGYDDESNGFDTGDIGNTIDWTDVPGGTVLSYQIQNAVDGFTVSFVADRVYYTSVRAVDNAGNTSAIQSSSAWTANFQPIILTSSNLSLWLDGADLTTTWQDVTCNTTQANLLGESIACWQDKSTGTNHVIQSVGASQPMVGLDGPDFDGADDFLQNNLAYTAASNLSIFFIFEFDTQSTDGGSCCRPIVSFVNNSSALFPWLGSTRGDYGPNDFLFFGWNGGPLNGFAAVIGDEYIFSATHDGTNDLWNAFSNGTNRTLNQAIPASYTGTTNFNIGGDSGNTARRFHGQILEVVVYESILSATDRQLVEGYLACKWDKRDQLDVTHPYYNATATNDSGCP